TSGLEGAAMTAEAFDRGLGEWGHYIVTVSVVFFAFSTVLGWAYYGERCIERLIGIRAVTPYRIVFSIVVFIGATTELSVVWTFSDVMNGLMALPNLIGLVICAGLIPGRRRRTCSATRPCCTNPPSPRSTASACWTPADPASAPTSCSPLPQRAYLRGPQRTARIRTGGHPAQVGDLPARPGRSLGRTGSRGPTGRRQAHRLLGCAHAHQTGLEKVRSAVVHGP